MPPLTTTAGLPAIKRVKKLKPKPTLTSQKSWGISNHPRDAIKQNYGYINFLLYRSHFYNNQVISANVNLSVMEYIHIAFKYALLLLNGRHAGAHVKEHEHLHYHGSIQKGQPD